MVKQRKLARDARVDDLMKEVDENDGQEKENKEDGRHREVYEKRSKDKIGKIMDKKEESGSEHTSDNTNSENKDQVSPASS